MSFKPLPTYIKKPTGNDMKRQTFQQTVEFLEFESWKSTKLQR